MAREKRMNAGFGFLKDTLCPSHISPNGENPERLISMIDCDFGTWNFGTLNLKDPLCPSDISPEGEKPERLISMIDCDFGT